MGSDEKFTQENTLKNY